jgi:predicted outer membrane repeat protein
MMYSPYGSTLLAQDCSFSDNSAVSGGALAFGIYPFNTLAFGSSFIVERSSFADNMASQNGGAMFVESAAVHVRFEDAVFVNNSADGEGGAIAMVESVSVATSTFSGNVAGVRGAAVSLLNGACALSLDASTWAMAVEIYFIQAAQVRIITFTDTPSLALPAPSAPTTPTTRAPITSFPTASPNTPAPMAQTDILAIASVSATVVVLLLAYIAYQRYKNAIPLLPDDGPPLTLAQLEAMHAEQMARRKVIILDIKDDLLFPCETIREACPICIEAGVACPEETFVDCAHSRSRVGLDDPALRNTFYKLPCGHMAHTACLIMWVELTRKTECPSCRFPVQLRNRWASSHSSDLLERGLPLAETQAESRRSTQADDHRAEAFPLRSEVMPCPSSHEPW